MSMKKPWRNDAGVVVDFVTGRAMPEDAGTPENDTVAGVARRIFYATARRINAEAPKYATDIEPQYRIRMVLEEVIKLLERQR